MGITDLQFSNWNYAVCKSFEDDNSSGDFGNGYRIDYARTINGVPVTQTIANGGALEDMDSTMETWSFIYGFDAVVYGRAVYEKELSR